MILGAPSRDCQREFSPSQYTCSAPRPDKSGPYRSRHGRHAIFPQSRRPLRRHQRQREALRERSATPRRSRRSSAASRSSRQVCVDGGGRVVKTIGDEVMAVFPAADGAARAATDMQSRISAQRTSRGAPLAIHVGFQLRPGARGRQRCVRRYGHRRRAAGEPRPGRAGVHVGSRRSRSCPPALRARTRASRRTSVKGKQKDIELFELVWQETEDELTALSTRRQAPPGAPHAQARRAPDRAFRQRTPRSASDATRRTTSSSPTARPRACTRASSAAATSSC